MNDRVSNISELFSRSWEQYKERALPLLAVVMISTAVIGGLAMVITLCVVFGGILLVHVENVHLVTYILVTVVSVAVLVITILAFWFQTSLLAIVIRDELGIIEAFQQGWTYLWPFTWVLTIYSGILLTGFVFGILPALVCMVWFTFCFYILIDEDRRGLDSLMASHEYVKGYWWDTFGKLLLIWFVSMVVGILPFIGTLLSILFYPFMMLYILNIYTDLKDIKGEVEVTAGQGVRIFWWIVTVIGLLLPLLALAGGIVALLSGDATWIEYIEESPEGFSL